MNKKSTANHVSRGYCESGAAVGKVSWVVSPQLLSIPKRLDLLVDFLAIQIVPTGVGLLNFHRFFLCKLRDRANVLVRQRVILIFPYLVLLHRMVALVQMRSRFQVESVVDLLLRIAVCSIPDIFQAVVIIVMKVSLIPVYGQQRAFLAVMLFISLILFLLLVPVSLGLSPFLQLILMEVRLALNDHGSVAGRNFSIV